MVVFSETEIQITVKDIESIEQYADLKFPEEYKQHLLKNNGGRCSPDVFSFYEDGRFNESCVNWFFSIGNSKYYELKDSIDTYKIEQQRLPYYMLPIAEDPGGNLICISCEGDDKGYIYFWDHENEVDYSISDDTDYSNLYLIAQSLPEFFDGLTELKDDEDIEE